MSEKILKAIKGMGDDVAAGLKKQGERLDKIEPLVKKWGEQATDPTTGRIYAKARDPKEEKKWGFKSFGEFCQLVHDNQQHGALRERLVKSWDAVSKTVSGMSEAVDSEGGFLVPPQFSQTIFERVYENPLLKMCDMYTVTGRTMVFPAIDERSRVNGSRHGGVLAYWRDEASTVTATKPKVRTVTLTLKSLMALGYITEELQQDMATAGDTFLTRHFAQEIEFKIGDAIYEGTGVGMPEGIKDADCTVEVAKETGQAAATITANNIWKMWMRMWAPSRQKACWFINQDVEPQLLGMTMPGATPAYPIYLPPGGLSDTPYATLLGRPVVPLEFCSTLGTVGDIMLADVSQHVAISKGTADTQMSMHLRFDYAENAYRTIFRIDAKPYWHSALTPFKGTNTQSPYIKLATRG